MSDISVPSCFLIKVSLDFLLFKCQTISVRLIAESIIARIAVIVCLSFAAPFWARTVAVIVVAVWNLWSIATAFLLTTLVADIAAAVQPRVIPATTRTACK